MIVLRGHGLALLPGGDPLRIVGLVVLAAGAAVRAAAMLQLGRRFSLHVALQEDHTLHTTGLYARIRHPSYLGLLLIMLDLTMVFESQLGVWATIVAFFMTRGRMARGTLSSRAVRRRVSAPHGPHQARAAGDLLTGPGAT